QPAAGHDVGHRKDEFDAALLDGRDDARALELGLVVRIRHQIRIHAESPANQRRRCCKASTLLPKRKSSMAATRHDTGAGQPTTSVMIWIVSAVTLTLASVIPGPER